MRRGVGVHPSACAGLARAGAGSGGACRPSVRALAAAAGGVRLRWRRAAGSRTAAEGCVLTGRAVARI